MAKLRDVLPKAEFVEMLFEGKAVVKHADVEVVIEHSNGILAKNPAPWPGAHRHVHCWWELANGFAVGWNENPSVGHSFPVVKLKSKV